MSRVFASCFSRKRPAGCLWAAAFFGALLAHSPTPGRAAALTVLWSEDWESPDWTKGWHADYGVYAVGVPKSGPGAAYSGDQCLATNLTGNYPETATSRMIRHTTFVVPQADQHPRLSFWHWFNFGGGDTAWVEVRVVGGNWEQVSPTYYAYSGVWSRALIDLSAHAGQEIEIAFHLRATSCCYGADNASGWYVDNVSLLAGVPVFQNPNDFEAGIGDCAVERGVWQVGVPSSGPGATISGESVVGTVLGGKYPEVQNSRFKLPPTMVPSQDEGPRLRFWAWYSFGGGDTGQVQLRVLPDGEWETISEVYGGTSGGWFYAYVDLSAFAGRTVQIAFYYKSTSCCYGADNAAGWYIDDVVLEPTEPPPPPDCNGNGTPDPEDIASGTSKDENANGIPDECEADSQVTFRAGVLEPASQRGTTEDGYANWEIGVRPGQQEVPVTLGLYLDSNLKGQDGIRGWSVSMETAECFEIVEVTTSGTAAADAEADPAGLRIAGFEQTEVVLSDNNNGRLGVVSAVVLSFDNSVTLDPVSEELVLKVHGIMDANGIQGHGDSVESCKVQPIAEEPWLIGSGQPVETVVSVNGESSPVSVLGAAITLVGVDTFVRGDADADGIINITDAINILSFLFTGGVTLPCLDAADTNDQGEVNITSAVYLLNWLFTGGPVPPSPQPSSAGYAVENCGADPTQDNLDCAAFAPCSS